MYTIESNIQIVLGTQANRINKIVSGKDEFLRTVALSVIGMIRERIHIKGMASDGSQIGTYSRGYLKVRQGLYADSKVGLTGKNAGIVTSAGNYSKKRIPYADLSGGMYSTGKTRYKYQKIQGEARPRYNRGSDPKVILSLTRQMESDYTVIATPNGYAIGFNNEFNYEKFIWMETKYKKPIGNLTIEERDFVKRQAENYALS